MRGKTERRFPGIGQALAELERVHGPVPASWPYPFWVDWPIGQERGMAVEAWLMSIDYLTAGDLVRADRLRWCAIAALRDARYRRAIYRCGPVGGPYSYHPLGG